MLSMLNSAFRRGSVDRGQRASWRLGATMSAPTEERLLAWAGTRSVAPARSAPGIRLAWQRVVCYRPYSEIVLANARSMRRSVSNLHRLAMLLMGAFVSRRSRLADPCAHAL